MLRVAGPRAWGVSSARDLSPEGVNLLATYSKVFAKVSCNWRACPRAFLSLPHTLFHSIFYLLAHFLALSFFLTFTRSLFFSVVSHRTKERRASKWTFLFEKKNRKFSCPSGTWHASPALSCSSRCPEATMYVNTFLLWSTELSNYSSLFFFQCFSSIFPLSLSPSLSLIFLSPSLSLSLYISRLLRFCFFTFLLFCSFVFSLTRDASKWIMEKLFLGTLDRSSSSRWYAFDKALTNDARDKMHWTHRNFAHLSWFHLVEFRAWSVRYQRYVNVSDNRLAAHVYGPRFRCIRQYKIAASWFLDDAHGFMRLGEIGRSIVT